MGTSQSSRGPGGGVPLVPPWTPAPAPVEPAGGAPSPPPPDLSGSPAVPPPPAPIPLAGPRRFASARTNLGSFARSGDGASLRRSLAHYVRSGYGGAATATRRFNGTARTAAALGDAMASVAAGGPTAHGSGLDPRLLTGRSHDEVIAAVVEAVRPIDGSLDAEASRASIGDALSDLLKKYPDANLLQLDDAQRAFVVEGFTAADVFRRYELDLGKTIFDKAPTVTAALARLKDVRDYIKEVVSASFRDLESAGRRLSPGAIESVVRSALADALMVFEEYLE